MSTQAAAYTPPADQPPAASGQQSPYGGFWARFAAHLVDGLILGVAAVAVAMVLYLMLGSDSSETVVNLMYAVLLFGGQLYHAYFLSSTQMATPGKWLCGVYVTDLEGRRLGFAHALGRNLAAALSYLTLYVGFIMAAFSKRKQALHDRIAGTLVHRRPSGSAGAVIAIVIVLFGGVGVIGILAAIAVPIFDDYGVRARVSSNVFGTIAPNKVMILVYEEEKGAWPTTWEQVGTNPMSNLQPGAREFVQDIRLGRDGTMIVDVKIERKTGQILVVPRKNGSEVEWTCSASPEISFYLPSSCRAK